ncbi:MAG: S46 family peptidase [Phycisphaerales bacterium]
MPQPRHRFGLFASALLLAASPWFAPRQARADEGMWLLNAPPTAAVRRTHGHEITPPWLMAMQRSAVDFAGGSGSLVSADGLVMTNHHVGSDAIGKLSTPQRDLLTSGFYARTRAEELPCAGVELKVLWEIRDVTDRVTNAAKAAADSAAAGAARRSEMAVIEQEAEKQTGLSCTVVTLYHGARFHLYLSKRFTDVRLVFAPEQQIAFFGGDADNFEYPRFNLDVAFFRIYENGQPLKPENFLKWSKAGSNEGDLGFVIGHPGSTRRLYTLDHLRFRRDTELPWTLRRLWRREIQLETFRGRSEAQALMAAEDYYNVANNRKRTTWQYEGLLNPAVWNAKAESERTVRSFLENNPALKEKWGGAWDAVANAQSEYRVFYRRWSMLNQDGNWGWSRLLTNARHVVRLAAEKPRPSPERLREYRDSNLDALLLSLYAEDPVHAALEIDRLASGLMTLAENLGADDELLKSLLAGKGPRERAAELVSGTKLASVEEVKRLVEGGAEAVNASKDPMIAFVRALDPEARRLRKQYEDTVEAVERENYAKIASAWFELMGDKMYPDATGTLRLSYGRVQGYTDSTPVEQGGEGVVPSFTTISGLFERAEARKQQPPFDLPESWTKARAALDPSMPFNFVINADIIGGNSGSPVVNKAGEVIGLIFDSNLHHLVSDFVFEPRTGRAVSVDSRAIVEALRKVYDAGALADELTK